MSDARKKVECHAHGETIATFVCQHLVAGSGLGFYYSESPDDLFPDAWCRQCDQILLQEGEWNDRSEAAARVTFICSDCYIEAKKRNAG